MSKELFDEKTEELKRAIELCKANKLIMPCLAMIYMTIDIMSFLDRDGNNPNVTRADYIKWVEKYLIPGLDLECSGIDLYGARCGIVHTYSFESDLTRKGKSKEIYYCWGSGDKNALQFAVDVMDKIQGIGKKYAIHVDDFQEALINSLEKFKEEISVNAERAKIVYERADKFFANIP